MQQFLKAATEAANNQKAIPQGALTMSVKPGIYNSKKIGGKKISYMEILNEIKHANQT
jgi:hypothetical protein